MMADRGTGPVTQWAPFGLFLACLFSMPGWLAGQVGPQDFQAMAARNIGPAGMSGRVAAVDVNLSDPTIIFVGASTGGVWRSSDGGVQWEPVFDDQPVLGIGSVAVFQQNPDVVWVGTGEGNPRNSVGVGAGIYRSLDGGESWELMGLEESERIHRVIPHPSDPDVVYAAALGPAWSDGEERGVFRSRDGGESWERVLYLNPRTGAADLVMDPSNPNKLFAAMWEYRRVPWSFQSGGPGSGLYVTYDGGDRWRQLTPEDGLPQGELGRIGLAIAPSDPSIVYALVEAERNALLRSNDGGRSWAVVSDEEGINPRPFYYADLRVDPRNENRLYRLASSIDVSEDGGREFNTVVSSAIIHGDVHELWIDPEDPRFLIMGNDGGIGISHNRGGSWRFVENLPLAQFYHINVDMAVPFNVYGGLQDNGSWYGPSQVWEDRGIMNAHWRRTGGGDGFASITDFSDSRYGYSMSQQGSLMRFDRDTGERRGIQPIHPEGVNLRFNWNAALNVDPHDSTTIYLGSQFVHRSRDGGLSWEIISPDLTTNDPKKQRQDESGGLTLDATGAENHTTILSIAPSPLERGLIWASTDDGNVQITRDDGESWTNLADRFRGVPAATWAPHVEPSKHDPAVAYVVFEDHRRGNWTSYIYRTEDYGQRWRALSTQGIEGFVHVLEEDPLEPNLLFVGTEFGLYLSLDRGGSWMPWRHGLPAAPVRALMVHPRDHDLVVGTHGRAVYILDDIRPLRALARDPALATRGVHLFDPPPALQVRITERIGYRSTGHAMFFGENRPFGALLSLWVGAELDGERARFRVLGEEGEELASFTHEVQTGINRLTWDLRGDAPGGGGGRSGPQGTPTLPGGYRLEVTVGEESSEASLTILPDPRVDIPVEERLAKIQALEEAGEWAALAREAQDRLEETQASVEGVLEKLGTDPADAPLREAGESLQLLLQEALEMLFTGPSCQGICGGDPLASRVRTPLSLLGSSQAAPSPNDRLAMAHAREALSQVVNQVNGIMGGEVARFRDMLGNAGYSSFPSPAPLRIGAGG
ncbi:WD40/YVTN/BNR-like repeat-containing protein [Gemmatimonadota bacterium]